MIREASTDLPKELAERGAGGVTVLLLWGSEWPEEELAALADGSLPDDRRELLEARVAESLDLASLLTEQRRAVAIIRGAALEVDAPARLRARVEAARRS